MYRCFCLLNVLKFENKVLQNTKQYPTFLILGSTNLDEVTGGFMAKSTFWTQWRIGYLKFKTICIQI